MDEFLLTSQAPQQEKYDGKHKSTEKNSTTVDDLRTSPSLDRGTSHSADDTNTLTTTLEHVASVPTKPTDSDDRYNKGFGNAGDETNNNKITSVDNEKELHNIQIQHLTEQIEEHQAQKKEVEKAHNQRVARLETKHQEEMKRLKMKYESERNNLSTENAKLIKLTNELKQQLFMIKERKTKDLKKPSILVTEMHLNTPQILMEKGALFFIQQRSEAQSPFDDYQEWYAEISSKMTSNMVYQCPEHMFVKMDIPKNLKKLSFSTENTGHQQFGSHCKPFEENGWSAETGEICVLHPIDQRVMYMDRVLNNKDGHSSRTRHVISWSKPIEQEFLTKELTLILCAIKTDIKEVMT